MKLLTTTEVADKLGVSVGRVKQWLDEGRLRASLTLPSGQRLIAAKDAKRPKAKKPGPKAAKANGRK